MDDNIKELLKGYDLEKIYKMIKKANCGSIIIKFLSVCIGLISWLLSMGLSNNPLLGLSFLIFGSPFLFGVPNIPYKNHFKKKIKKDYPDIQEYRYTYGKRCNIKISDFRNLYITKDYNLVDCFDEQIILEEPSYTSVENNNNNNNVTDSAKIKRKNINININGINMKVLTNEPQNFNWAIGREFELQNLIENLYSKKTNPILVGEPGVGKTSLIKGLAYKIQRNEIPDVFKNKEIYTINISELESGTMYRGTFEKKMESFIKFAEDKNKIIFIDEIHSIIGIGSSMETKLDASNILKPYLEDGSINVIGATTEEEYEKYILSDKAFSSRFSKIVINEPDEKTLAMIVKENIKYFEKEYEAKFFDEKLLDTIIESLIELTLKKHRNYRDMEYNPRLIIKIIDKAFVKCKLSNRNVVNLGDICDAIKDNSKLYTTAKDRTIKTLNSNNIDTNKSKQKIIKVNFKK